jgi:hypothetical protein
MKKENIFILASFGLMLVCVGFAWSAFVQKNEALTKLDTQVSSNVALQNKNDSLIFLLRSTPTDSGKNVVLNQLQLNAKEFTKLNDPSGYEQASQLEQEGFTAIAANNFDTALAKFKAAEATSPSFHMSYEISRLLNSKQRDFKNRDSLKSIKRQIINNYTWGTPKSLIDSLKIQVKQ